MLTVSAGGEEEEEQFIRNQEEEGSLQDRLQEEEEKVGFMSCGEVLFKFDQFCCFLKVFNDSVSFSAEDLFVHNISRIESHVYTQDLFSTNFSIASEA